MDRLSSRESRAFRNGLLAGLVVLAGALAGSWSDPAPASCDASGTGSQAIARLFDRVTPQQPLLRAGHRVTRELITRALGGACD